MKLLKRFLMPVKWHSLRTTQPVSNVFGFDRGTPIDRYYIEKFLEANRSRITGKVLEIAEDTYTRKFGHQIEQSLILQFSGPESPNTIIGDLTDKLTLKENSVNCFVCTQTFNFIYEVKRAIQGAYFVLKEDGTLLATLAGLCQISEYDMKRWGDYWRFTTLSAAKVFGEVFGEENVKVASYGNVLSAISLLHGISVEELTEEELAHHDPNYQVIITVVAKKC